jgi:hypothetical protein
MKVRRAEVPCKRRKTSSLLWTNSRSLGKTSMILAKSEDYLSFVFFSKEHKRSITCCKIELSTMVWNFCSVVEDLSAERSTWF